MFEVKDTGANSAEKNMQIDEIFLEDLREDDLPILHFYDWEDRSATFGHFIDIKKFIDEKQVIKENVLFAKRPTGGGIIFHIWDFAFSFFMSKNHFKYSKNVLENYRFVNDFVKKAIEKFLKNSKNSYILTPDDFEAKEKSCNFFCMAKPTKYDVIINGRKVAGAAQRNKKQGYLHQGSISLFAPDLKLLDKIFLKDVKTHIIDAMTKNSFYLLGEKSSKKDVFSAREDLKKLLKAALKEALS